MITFCWISSLSAGIGHSDITRDAHTVKSSIHAMLLMLFHTYVGYYLHFANSQPIYRCLMTPSGSMVRSGQDARVNEVLMRLRRLLRNDPNSATAAFADVDADGDGRITSMELLGFMQRLLPGKGLLS
jgi:hypothetical protein